MKKKIFSIACFALLLLCFFTGNTVQTANANELQEAGDILGYDFNLCYGLNTIQSGCEIPVLAGPCYRMSVCHPNPGFN